MTKKLAILNIADTGALESTWIMFDALGYEVRRPNEQLLQQIRACGCSGVFSVKELKDRMGYDDPMVTALASPDDTQRCSVFVDVKAHVNYPYIVKRWPNLERKVLWCCLNGGNPTKRTDGLPWANPPCPVLTNNQWYKDSFVVHNQWSGEGHAMFSNPAPWNGRAYVCYPPYARWFDRKQSTHDGPPICLVHNVRNWGYGHLVDAYTDLGGKAYGWGDTPHGLLPYKSAMAALERALCQVYLKKGDTVGYAAVEAIAAGVPMVVTQEYIRETRLEEMFKLGTCAVVNTRSVDKFQLDLQATLRFLNEPGIPTQIGKRARENYLRLQWNARNSAHIDGWESFVKRNFA